MQDKAVIDAYLGAHQDVDLGEVTGRIAVVSEEAARMRAEIAEESEAELEAEEESK
jgi:neutral amino acid transport system ATP-binding protein